MGSKTPSQLIYSIENLSMEAARDVALSLKKTPVQNVENTVRSSDEEQDNEDEENQNINPSSMPHADVDCNWIAFMLGANKCPHEAASKTADFLECLANYGFIVTPICDGKERHHSKRASMERIAKKEKAK